MVFRVTVLTVITAFGLFILSAIALALLLGICIVIQRLS